jgi:hypothetical protein
MTIFIDSDCIKINLKDLSSEVTDVVKSLIPLFHGSQQWLIQQSLED